VALEDIGCGPPAMVASSILNRGTQALGLDDHPVTRRIDLLFVAHGSDHPSTHSTPAEGAAIGRALS
jgi:hypothetical protein